MLAEKQIETEEIGAAPAVAIEPKVGPSGDQDLAWAKENLRWADEKPIPDMANVLRVLDRHPDFKGRYIYNETLNKVLDKGTLMLDWRVSECCAVIQERFVPEIPESAVNNALVICANRNGTRK